MEEKLTKLEKELKEQEEAANPKQKELKEMTEDEYKRLRDAYSTNDKKEWEEEGLSEQEIRELIEYEARLTPEQKDENREIRIANREFMKKNKENLKHHPDSKKSEKELLIDIKDYLFSDWKLLTNLPDIKEKLDDLQEVIAALKFIMLFVGIIGLVLIYIAFNI